MASESGSRLECERVWRNARLATMAGANGERGLGIVERGAVASHGGRIVYVGPEGDLPQVNRAAEIIDCEGRWITPGLIDCHTHLIYADCRAHEFELRLAGATYEEIARAGGGIVSSVKALRAASEDELVRQGEVRLKALMAEGLTTIEIKSGYGLNLENERKTLRAARRLGVAHPVTVTTTFLGAHALPPEYKGNQSGYVDDVVNKMLPAIASEGLADAVDAFLENIAFTPEETARIFERATALGLPVKLHADQLSNSSGAALAARYHALSADHLEHTDEAGVAAMAKAGTVAVLLPGAFYFIRETKLPPFSMLRQYGVPMAIATDCNPGTCPLTSLLLTMNMAATMFRMTVDECLLGVTREGARALGLEGKIGTLEVGKSADLAIWNVSRPAELVYHMGASPLHARVWRGQ